LKIFREWGRRIGENEGGLNSIENLEEIYSETVLKLAKHVIPSFAFTLLPNQAEKPSLDMWIDVFHNIFAYL
jgi:hypothetical protein